MTDIQFRLKRAFAQLSVGLLVLFQLIVLLPPSVQAASANLVISEVQTGAGTDEFVELYNRSASNVDVSGWTVQYKSAAGVSYTTKATIPAGTSVSSHGYYLIAGTGYSSSTSANLTVSLGLSSDGGHVRLVNSGTVIDTVGWGTADSPESAAALAPGSGQSIERKPGGINGNGQDTDDNAADFSLRASPNPQSSVSTPQPSAPEAPVLNSVISGDGTVTLDWSAVSGANDYKVYQDGVALSPVVNAPTTAKLVSGLTNGTSYSFRVSARNNFGMEGALSNTLNTTPTRPVIVEVAPVSVSITYRESGGTVAKTHFGVSAVTAQVATTPFDALSASDNPTLTFSRPHSAPVTVPLVFDSVAHVWNTSIPYSLGASTGGQDGSVIVTLNTSTGVATQIVTGSSFTVDTTVNKPVVTVTSRCSTAQDSFTATTDTDVTNVYVYKSSDLSSSNLVAVAASQNGKVDEVFIGDNSFGVLYLVAQDSTGNRSSAAEIVNDITAPSVPLLQLESGNRVITASWLAVSDASSYLLRWRLVGSAIWQERVVTGTSSLIAVENNKQYEVSLASIDAACNQSGFATVFAKARSAAVFASAPRGGVADREALILAQLRAPIAIAETKDGAADGFVDGQKSPFSLEEDRDQNGLKDSEEDKDKNGIKDGEEDKDNNGIKDRDEDKNNNGIKDGDEKDDNALIKDRSKWIIALAILLILAGTAVAAYAWYQGERGAVAPPVKRDKNVEAAPPAEEPKTKKTGAAKKSAKGKKKTHW